MSSDLIGFDKRVLKKKNKTIAILVEKYFACPDASEKENEGTYPNPLIKCQPKESVER